MKDGTNGVTTVGVGRGFTEVGSSEFSEFAGNSVLQFVEKRRQKDLLQKRIARDNALRTQAKPQNSVVAMN